MWPIQLNLKSNSCPYNLGDGWCIYEDIECRKEDCLLFIETLPHRNDDLCGRCGCRGIVLRYEGMWQCDDCLHDWIKNNG